MKIEYTRVWGFEHTIRGMRNSHDSHDRSDSGWRSYLDGEGYKREKFVVGKADKELMLRLAKKEPSHRKFLRTIFISVDITTTLTLWKQLDTYKIGTTELSESTMHNILKEPITIDCFNFDSADDNTKMLMDDVLISNLEELREVTKKYLKDGNANLGKRYWQNLIDMLPGCYLQKRTWTANYEVLKHIYHDRKNHKLKEWEQLIDWIETLPEKELIKA